jgi:peptide subunit release factor 1 (eRF1)
LFEDLGSTRVNLPCPQCQQLFKVRLRKLQFGADLTCRLCRHEFSARDVSTRTEVSDALARLQQVLKQPVRLTKPPSQGGTVDDGRGHQQAEFSAALTKL